MTIYTLRNAEKLCEKQREKIWKVLRSLREFTAADVAVLAETGEVAVRTYINALYYAGYIKPVGRRSVTTGRKRIAWRLFKNTGPKAPKKCSCIYDPNVDTLSEIKIEKIEWEGKEAKDVD